MKSSLLERLPAEERKLPRRAAQPEWLQPMLATLTHDHFSNPEWIFEPKLDGERCLAFRKGRRARLLSRNRKELNDTYRELVDALERQKAEDFVVDGEIVALRGSVTSFSQLQQRMQVRHASELLGKRVPIFYYLFDLPFVDGYDTTKLALDQRKALLKDLLTFKDPLRYSEHRDEEGEAYLAEACRMGWEGLIAKRTDSPYVHARSRDWLKFKCINEQEFVIGGFTDPKGSRVGFGALLLGYYQHGKLKYAGQVGTGFNTETLRRLHDRSHRSSETIRRSKASASREVACIGLSPGSSPSVASPNGLPTTSCDTRGSSAFAETKSREKCYESDHERRSPRRRPDCGDHPRRQSILP